MVCNKCHGFVVKWFADKKNCLIYFKKQNYERLIEIYNTFVYQTNMNNVFCTVPDSLDTRQKSVIMIAFFNVNNWQELVGVFYSRLIVLD